LDRHFNSNTKRDYARTSGRLPEPPSEWRDSYASMAAEDSLPWSTLEDVFEAAKAFVEPVLSDAACPPIWM